MSNLILRTSRFAARHLAKSVVSLRKGRGVVSVSFDDVPTSACQYGASLLEDYEGSGSFFVCGGLTDRDEQAQRCHSIQDLLQLQESGHEIGCHTYSHLNCPLTSSVQLKQDWALNRRFFAEHGIASEGFAFPFGAYDLRTKLAARQHFSYARTTSGGPQFGVADLYALRAQALYSHSLQRDDLLGAIRQTAEQGGWLILYTHEVDEIVGKWGCTTEDLRLVLDFASQQACQILSIKQAISYFTSR